MNDDPSGMGVIPPFPGRQVPSPFVPMPSPVPLPITPGNRNNPPMQYFMAPRPPMPTPVPMPPPPPQGDGYFDNSMQWGGGAAVANPALIVQGGGRYEEDGSVTYPAAPSQKMQWPFPAPPKPRY